MRPNASIHFRAIFWNDSGSKLYSLGIRPPQGMTSAHRCRLDPSDGQAASDIETASNEVPTKCRRLADSSPTNVRRAPLEGEASDVETTTHVGQMSAKCRRSSFGVASDLASADLSDRKGRRISNYMFCLSDQIWVAFDRVWLGFGQAPAELGQRSATFGQMFVRLGHIV